MNQVTTKAVNDIDSCIERMKKEGFLKKFVIRPEGLYDEETGKYYESHDVKIISFYFFGSESNANDGVIIYGIETHDNIRGTIISTKIIQ